MKSGDFMNGVNSAMTAFSAQTITELDQSPENDLSAHRVDFVRRRSVKSLSRPRFELAAVEPAAIAPVETSARPARTWMRTYQNSVVVIDFLSAAFAAFAAFAIRFQGFVNGSFAEHVLLLAFPFAWVAMVGLNRAYESRFMGVGAEEFQRVLSAFLYLTAAVAIVSYATKAQFAREFVGISLVVALALDLVGRYGARKVLHSRRRNGRGLLSVLVVGGRGSVVQLTDILRRDTSAGMRVVGACVPPELLDDPVLHAELVAAGVPLLGDLDSVREVVDRVDVDVVAVTASDQIGSDKLRWISWQLEDCSADLVVAPGLMDVAGSRLHIRPVGGLPLLHVGRPEFTGVRRVVKGVIDRVVAACALVVLSPLFLLLTVMIRRDSKGGAFFRQTRVGRDGRTFRMVKFRSMYSDAEARKAELLALNESDGLLFKMKDDPRITRAGRILRRTSLDELPQLINVVRGSMSLVGPRPPLPDEVSGYGDDVRRRLLVKPGVTGLWQVSGRSDLSWDESVRLDLRYVENWSLATDLMIIWKTLFAVAGSSGAY
jgi:exopolysaccharide biosynthesis polyprenyl glycosylphosphotransferase